MILKALSEAIGISGKEDAVRKVILEAIDGHAENIRIDALGSVTALKTASKAGDDAGNRPRVMLAAHMDEIGFMVTGYDSDGYIHFTNVGGVDERILLGQRVLVGEDKIPGLILSTPIHKSKDMSVTRMNSLRIDIGASSKDQVSGKAKLGDRIAFVSEYMELGEKTLRGKAFDDRVGCSILVDVLQGEPYAADVLAAFTVQEEIGTRGAKVAAKILKPDVAIILEASPCADIPNPNEDADADNNYNPTAKLGDGPVITIMDRSMIAHPRLRAFVQETAEKHGIPYQFKTTLGGGTDGGAVHVSHSGIPTVVISVPCRYIHTPISLLNRDDYDNALRLVKAVLNDIQFASYQEG